MNRFQCLCILILAYLSMMFVTLVGGCATTRPAYEESSPLSCPEGTDYNPIRKVCESVCNNGEKWDTATKGCSSVCGSGYRYDGFKCVSLCKGETTWDGLNQTCVCPAGKFPTEMGLCLTMEELKCEAEKARKAVIERAAQLEALRKAYAEEHPAPTCKSGTKWDIHARQCLTICKGGTWNDSQLTCICPTGQVWEDFFGECRPPRKLIND